MKKTTKNNAIILIDINQYFCSKYRISVLAAFLSDKTDEASRQKIILEFIDFFLMAEELQNLFIGEHAEKIDERHAEELMLSLIHI